MRLKYKGKKWDKEMKEIEKNKKFFGENYLNNINWDLKKIAESSQKDYCWFFGCLSGEYATISKIYVQEGDIKNVLVNTYLSALAFFVLKRLYEKGIQTNYQNIQEDLLQLEYMTGKMIAIDCYDNVQQYCKDSIIGNLFIGNMENIKKSIEQLPDNGDELEDIYYNTPIFLKSIYIAILNKDEKEFNDALIKRVKKYRKNMLGYSTIIDYTSIALIKVAKKYGISCDLNIIEMPDYFFKPINVEGLSELRLPLQEDVNRILI